MVEATGPRAERSDAVANRARVLTAAREEFAARGLDAEMKDIAARADVGVGTLYRHFESRDGLLAALIEETRAELLARLQRAAAMQAPADAFREVLRTGAEMYAQFGALIEVAMAGKLGQIGEQQHDDATAIMDALLRRGIAEGAFRADLDVRVTIAAIESVFVSGKLVELATERGYPAAADAFARAFLAGIAT